MSVRISRRFLYNMTRTFTYCCTSKIVPGKKKCYFYHFYYIFCYNNPPNAFMSNKNDKANFMLLFFWGVGGLRGKGDIYNNLRSSIEHTGFWSALVCMCRISPIMCLSDRNFEHNINTANLFAYAIQSCHINEISFQQVVLYKDKYVSASFHSLHCTQSCHSVAF